MPFRKSDVGATIDDLRHLALFAKLDNADLHRVAELGEPVEAEAGAHLIAQGDVGAEGFLVLVGEAGVLSGDDHVATSGPWRGVRQIAPAAGDALTAPPDQPGQRSSQPPSGRRRTVRPATSSATRALARSASSETPQARRPSGRRAVRMARSGAPSRSCITVHASTVPSPSGSSQSARAGRASTSSCTSAWRNPSAGGSVL